MFLAYGFRETENFLVIFYDYMPLELIFAMICGRLLVTVRVDLNRDYNITCSWNANANEVSLGMPVLHQIQVQLHAYIGLLIISK